MKTSLTKNEIIDLLPHRDPMLLIAKLKSKEHPSKLPAQTTIS